MERSMVKVLKALAEFEGLTLGQLPEECASRSFEPVDGQEGERPASPNRKRALDAGDMGAVHGEGEVVRGSVGVS